MWTLEGLIFSEPRLNNDKRFDRRGDKSQIGVVAWRQAPGDRGKHRSKCDCARPDNPKTIRR